MSAVANLPEPPRTENWVSSVTRLLLRVALTAVLVYFLVHVGFIIVVVLVAAMLALTLAPAVEKLASSATFRPIPRPWRRGTATALVFLVLAALLVLLAVLLLQPLIVEMISLFNRWPDYQQAWLARLRGFRNWYDSLPADVRSTVEQYGFQDLGGRLASQVQSVLGGTLEKGMLLVELILIPVLAFSFLTEGRSLKRELVAFFPREKVRDVLRLLRQMGVILQSYSVGQLTLALIAGIVVYVMMVALDIRYALALAVVAAITRVIPILGPVIGGVPIVIMSSLQGWDKGVAVLVLFSLLHLVESKVIMPSLIGYRIKLHPAVVILALLIGAQFFGMWGMFLAAPAAAVARMFLHHFYVRPKKRAGRRPPPPGRPAAAEGARVERSAVGGVRSHSGAH